MIKNGINRKIKNVPINEKAYKVLKEAIIRQRLDICVNLSENELAESLGISRTPLREALKKLEINGFVERKSNNRVKITNLSVDHLKDLYLVRSRLEGLSAGLAAKNINENEINELERLLVQSKAMLNNNDYDGFDNSSRLFHHIIRKSSNNNVCIKIINNLSDHINRYRWLAITTHIRTSDIFEEHAKILYSIRKGDSETAENVMKEHILLSSKVLISNLGYIVQPEESRHSANKSLNNKDTNY